MKKISIFDTFCLGLNAIIGSGIFIFPGLLAKEVGPASILAFAVCGLMLVFVALCYAELGSMFKQNGGPYVFAKEAFGPWTGFGVGWISWVTSVFCWAAVASAVSSSLAYFHPGFDNPNVTKALAAALVLGFGFINYRGIKLGAWMVNFFTMAKLVPLILFVAVGFFWVKSANYTPFWNPPTGSFSQAVFLSLWALQGFEVTPLPSGESVNPQKAVPIAAVGSLLCATLVYVLIQIVAVGVYPTLANAGTKPLAEAASHFMGPMGGTIMALGAVLSMVGFNSGNALGCPRLLSALAENNHLPPRLALQHPRYKTPSLAILVTCVLTTSAALFMSFQSLVHLANLVVILQYLATCSAVIWLRYKKPNAVRLFKLPLATPIALAGCAISLWLVKEVKTSEFLLGGLVIVIGFLCMAAWHRISLKPSSE